jgi:hypothetical protein
VAHPYHHALASVKKWGGCVEDYQPIHDWFDESKAFLADYRHRALRHHAEGIFLAERFFGKTIRNRDGRRIPVRWIGEQHVKEDLGWIPTASDWLKCIRPEPWMGRTGEITFDEPKAWKSKPKKETTRARRPDATARRSRKPAG